MCIRDRFLIGCIGIIFGLSIFLTGVNLSISKIGTYMGDFIAKSEKIIKVIIFGIFIGFIISIAEPDLLILANQVRSAIGLSSLLIVAIISIGVGFMISLGLFRIFKEIKLSTLMFIIYGVIFILMFIVNDLSLIHIFMNEVIEELKLEKAKAVHVRAEDYAKDHREEFDMVISRADVYKRQIVDILIKYKNL